MNPASSNTTFTFCTNIWIVSGRCWRVAFGIFLEPTKALFHRIVLRLGSSRWLGLCHLGLGLIFFISATGAGCNSQMGWKEQDVELAFNEPVVVDDLWALKLSCIDHPQLALYFQPYLQSISCKLGFMPQANGDTATLTSLDSSVKCLIDRCIPYTDCCIS